MRCCRHRGAPGDRATGSGRGSAVRRVVLLAVAVLAAAILQPSVVNPIGLPLGPPQLLVLVVLAAALADGPLVGMGTGFAAGLLADLLSTHLMGRTAIALTVTGYAVGQLASRQLSPRLVVAAGAWASLLAVGGDAALGALLGDRMPGAGAVLATTLGAALYGAVLAPVLFAPLRAGLRREPASR